MGEDRPSAERYKIPTEYVLQVRNALSRLSRSGFRSGFLLNSKDAAYAREKGSAVIASHAADFISERLAPAFPKNDGKQTPMRGHPVFTAQHATATCCRSCLYKWHHIPAGRELTEEERSFCVALIMAWIGKQFISE